jgi:hypothetical protein
MVRLYAPSLAAVGTLFILLFMGMTYVLGHPGFVAAAIAVANIFDSLLRRTIFKPLLLSLEGSDSDRTSVLLGAAWAVIVAGVIALWLLVKGDEHALLIGSIWILPFEVIVMYRSPGIMKGVVMCVATSLVVSTITLLIV